MWCSGRAVIGSGIPTFGRPVGQELVLLDVRRLEDSKLVALQYAVSGAGRN
jgi:hypothetical protein